MLEDIKVALLLSIKVQSVNIRKKKEREYIYHHFNHKIVSEK